MGKIERQPGGDPMKVKADRKKCEAHGQCNLIDEDIFTLDEDGYTNIGPEKHVDDMHEANVEQGVHNCPVGALSFEAD